MVFIGLGNAIVNKNTALIELLKTRALQKGNFKLASGQNSTYYLDCKGVTLHGPSLQMVSAAFWAHLKTKSPQPRLVAGVSVGGDPLVAGIALEAAKEKVEVSCLLVRKEPKTHGLSVGKAVDGGIHIDPQNGVWLIEDVISTGGSSLKAANYLKAEGFKLEGILVLVDRKMGGVESLTKTLNVPVESLLTVDEILG